MFDVITIIYIHHIACWDHLYDLPSDESYIMGYSIGKTKSHD